MVRLGQCIGKEQPLRSSLGETYNTAPHFVKGIDEGDEPASLDNLKTGIHVIVIVWYRDAVIR